MLKNILTFTILALSVFTWSQKSNKAPIYFAEPIMVDSNSTVIIPTRYDSDLLTSSKFAVVIMPTSSFMILIPMFQKNCFQMILLLEASRIIIHRITVTNDL